MKEVVRRATAEHKGWSNVVLRWRHKDGSWRHIESSGVAAFDPDGNLLGLRGVDRDITDRKNAENALRESEERFRAIFNGTLDGIALVDATNRKFVMGNKNLCAMLGCTEDELRAMQPDAIHPADAIPRMVKHLEETLRGEISVAHDMPVKRKDGSIFFADISATAVLIDGRTHFIGVFRDVTERKKVGDALRASEAMLRQSQRVAGIGHYTYDTAGGTWSSSEMLDCIFGIRPDHEKTTESWLQIVHPDQRREMMEYLRNHVLRDHLPFNKEYRIIRMSDQAVRWVHGLGNFEYRPDGTLEKMFGTIQDITERKQAEEALRNSEELLNTILNNVGAYIFIKDTHYRYTYVNRKVCDLFGRNAQDIVGKGDDAFFSPASVEEIMQSDRPVIEQGETVTREETELVSSDNLPHTYWTIKIPLRDNNGTVSGLCGISTDISGLKNAEGALRESQAKLDLALRSARMGVWHLDLINNRRTFDDQTCLLLGIDPATFTGSAEEFFGAVHPDDRGSIRVALAQTIEQDTLYETEYRTIWPDGSVHYITARGRLVRDDKGLPVGINGIIWDITERKKSEELLRASERKFSAIFSLTPDPTAITDIGTGRIIDLNGSFEQLTGRSREELIGMTTADLHVWEDLSDRDRMLREIRNSGEINDMAVRLRRYDGEIRETLFSARIIELNGKRYLLGRSHDITEVKRAEEEKRELERQLMQAHRIESLGGLAGGIAHDFNNLLQGIFGYISMAKMTIDQKERALSMLDQAEKALHQSVSLSTQLLTFSKGGKPVRKKLALGPVIENTVKFALSGSRADYDMNIDADLWSVEADEGQIGQVIQNLVINADQAMPVGGRIVITADNVQAPGENIPVILPQGSYVRISVQDSGIGIPAQYLERIFDPYFTTKEKGSGLGLAISYSIARNHGGTIHVSSEISKGSTFSVYLPATVETQDVAPAPEKVRGQVKKARILVMDDEAMVRDVAKAMITTLRHEVECAEHGEEAVMKYLQARQQGMPFDIVILDLTIRGGMGGEETIKRLLEIDPQVKAVVSSGYADDSVIADYQSYGFCATLSKPYTMKALSNTLESLLAS
jgi:PAS domain S-box-containing protein